MFVHLHLYLQFWILPQVTRTGCCILVDKEEIGSVGATGMHSRFFENIVAELVAMTDGESRAASQKSSAEFQNVIFRCKCSI